MPVTRETFGTYMSRLGYLPQDQNMDEGFNFSKYHKLHKLSTIILFSAKLGDGRQKFILKESTEGTTVTQVPRTKYNAFAYQVVATLRRSR